MWSTIGIRVGIAAFLVASVSGAFWYVSGLRDDNARLTTINTSQSTALATLQTAMTINQETSDGYQTELKRLRARARTPAPSVYQCAGDQVPVSAAAGGSDGARAGSLPGAAGPDRQPIRDIGPELYALAQDADESAAQLAYCQAWARKVTAP